MSTYDPQHTLDAISSHALAVVAIGGLSIVAMFVFFIEGARMGRPGRGVPDGAVDDCSVVAARRVLPAALRRLVRRNLRSLVHATVLVRDNRHLHRGVHLRMADDSLRSPRTFPRPLPARARRANLRSDGGGVISGRW